MLAELLSDPELPDEVRELLCRVPLVDLKPGYGERAGLLRATGLEKGRKARLGDALIAQGCVDRGIPLLTRDKDFRNFADTAELK